MSNIKNSRFSEGLFEGIFKSESKASHVPASEINPEYLYLKTTDVTRDFRPDKHSVFIDFIDELAAQFNMTAGGFVSDYYSPTRDLNTIELFEIRNIDKVPFNLTQADVGEHLFESFMFVVDDIIPFENEQDISLFIKLQSDLLQPDTSKRFALKAWLSVAGDVESENIPLIDFNSDKVFDLAQVSGLINVIKNASKLNLYLSKIESYVQIKYKSPEYTFAVSDSWSNIKSPQGEDFTADVVTGIKVNLETLIEPTLKCKCFSRLIYNHVALVSFHSDSIGLVQFKSIEKNLVKKAEGIGYQF